MEGLQSKKNAIKEMIVQEKIQVLCVQESEIKTNLDHNLLSFPGFALETENNKSLSRVAIFISNKIDYIRRRDLEGVDSNLMVLDLVGDDNWRIINLYRSFSPQNITTQREKFRQQLQIIKSIINSKTILLGDFNLDLNRRFEVNYAYKNYFEDFEEILGDNEVYLSFIKSYKLISVMPSTKVLANHLIFL